jgi:hypothetical protein
MDRDTFMQGMKDRNIGTGLHYRAVHLYPYYREHFGFKRGDFPNAETISDRIVSLPLFPTIPTDHTGDRGHDDLFGRNTMASLREHAYQFTTSRTISMPFLPPDRGLDNSAPYEIPIRTTGAGTDPESC